MNKKEENSVKSPFKGIFGGKIKDILLIGALAVTLLVTAWKIFQEDGVETSALPMSEKEIKVLRILEEIDGVGKASVVVCETEEQVQSVVVVCEGGNNLRVIMDIREAVSAALNTKEQSVKVYLKKE